MDLLSRLFLPENEAENEQENEYAPSHEQHYFGGNKPGGMHGISAFGKRSFSPAGIRDRTEYPDRCKYVLRAHR